MSKIKTPLIERWATKYVNTMALLRTILSVVTGFLSIFIFLEIFGYLGGA